MNDKVLGLSFALLVTALTACNAEVVKGSGGSGTGGSGTGGSQTGGSDGGSTCPPPNPGLCPPSTACVGGMRQSGGASCENGEWVCQTTPCSECSQNVTWCQNGMIVTTCCQPGVDCNPPICDLGNGACLEGPCIDAGSAPVDGG
jgi:hypothetical protein